MWIIILSLLFIGLALIIIELIFIPGTTVVGLLGAIFTIVGVVITYNHFGRQIGFYLLLSTLVITLAALFYSFRSGAWKKFSLKSSIQSKVNEGLTAALSIGDEGTTVSALRPMGKAEFNFKTFEVKTMGNYVEQGQPIKIIRIQSHEIIVEPLA